jgi:rubredoxin
VQYSVGLAAHLAPKTEKTTMKTYLCIVCGFVYDEAAGRPEDGIAAGTLWADVPGGWACPDCGVAKADFELVEI